jgi:hypothetical protein
MKNLNGESEMQKERPEKMHTIETKKEKENLMRKE